jgi:hypothetical protein
VAGAARRVVERRLPEGAVPLSVAQSFIRRATWWNTHASGGPVLAVGFAERITGVDGDRRLRFGANTFLVGSAILKCHGLLTQYVDAYKVSNVTDPAQSITSMRTAIRCSVVGYDGNGLGLYPLKGDDMHFGAHSIDVRYFIKALLDHLPTEIAAPLIEANEARRP